MLGESADGQRRQESDGAMSVGVCNLCRNLPDLGSPCFKCGGSGVATEPRETEVFPAKYFDGRTYDDLLRELEKAKEKIAALEQRIADQVERNDVMIAQQGLVSGGRAWIAELIESIDREFLSDRTQKAVKALRETFKL